MLGSIYDYYIFLNNKSEKQIQPTLQVKFHCQLAISRRLSHTVLRSITKNKIVLGWREVNGVLQIWLLYRGVLAPFKKIHFSPSHRDSCSGIVGTISFLRDLKMNYVFSVTSVNVAPATSRPVEKSLALPSSCLNVTDKKPSVFELNQKITREQ